MENSKDLMPPLPIPATAGTHAALADPDSFFETHARYDPRNGSEPYSITFNGYGFISHDTADLARKFRRAVARYRRKESGTPASAGTQEKR